MKIEIYQNDLPDNHPFLDPSFSKELAIDTETMGLVSGRDRLCLVQLSAGDGGAVLIQYKTREQGVGLNLQKILQDETRGKIFHFARFDLLALQTHFNVPIRGPLFCTKMASKIARTSTDKHGLKDLSKSLLDIDLRKEQQGTDWGSDILSEEQKNYAANDVIYLHDLKEKLTVLLKREHRWEIAQKLFSFLPLLLELDRLGFKAEEILSH